MRRTVALLFSLSAVAWLTPSVFAQYPYPYPAPVYQPAPMPYGYYPPAPMPYGYYPPAPMPYGYGQSAPMPYYPSAPMPNAMAPQSPRVYVYGPLEEAQPMPAPVQPAPKQPAPKKLPDAVKTATPKTKSAATDKTAQAPAKSGVAQVQALPLPQGAEPPMSGWAPPMPFTLPSFGGHAPEGCGCAGGGCDSGCGACDSGCLTCIPHTPPQLGHGQFIGEIGANILVPYQNPRQAYNTNANGTSSGNDFPREVDAGPFVSLGYLCHNGWGVRADYWYLNGSQGQTVANNAPTTTIGTPLGSNFQFTSPSPTLAAGIGADGYTFTQTLNINVADLEVIRDVQFMDTTFLFGCGARYARIDQTYSAVQNNPGGANGVITVAQDRQDANAANTFEGWGPTISLEIMHAIPRSCFSIYGNARGSFLWGNDTFNQSLRTQNNTVTTAGLANPIDITSINSVVNHREISIGEAEIGVQYGSRCGPCYVFVRAGASLQRWWDVGSPSTSNGNLSFLGGVARIGVAY